MNVNDQLRAIEIRKEQAIKKNLSKKITLVLKVLGHDIVEHGESRSETIGDITDDPYWLHDENEEMPTMEQEPIIIGRYFDGLSGGKNIQICAMYAADETIRSFWVTFNGIKVYQEISGILEGYVPSPQWEKSIESLYELAAQRVKIKERESSVDKQQDGIQRSQLQKVVSYLRERWGIFQ